MQQGDQNNFEQPGGEKNKLPKKNIRATPKSLGYGDFDVKKHQKAKAQAGQREQEEGEETAEELKKILSEMNSVDAKKTLNAAELENLDQQVSLTKDQKKNPQEQEKALKAKEKSAFTELVTSLGQKNKIPVVAYGQAHVFEYKGLSIGKKDIQPKEQEKILEHIDKGGEVPKNIEFHFQAGLHKDDSDTIKADFHLSLRQIMIDGFQATLRKLLIATYDGAGSKNQQEKAQQQKEQQEATQQARPETHTQSPLQNLAGELAKKNPSVQVNINSIGAMEVHMPGQQKQLTILYNGEVFQSIDVKSQQAKKIASTPPEAAEYIENELNK